MLQSIRMPLLLFRNLVIGPHISFYNWHIKKNTRISTDSVCLYEPIVLWKVPCLNVSMWHFLATLKYRLLSLKYDVCIRQFLFPSPKSVISRQHPTTFEGFDCLFPELWQFPTHLRNFWLNTMKTYSINAPTKVRWPHIITLVQMVSTRCIR
jgi:hypothetical protein